MKSPRTMNVKCGWTRTTGFVNVNRVGGYSVAFAHHYEVSFSYNFVKRFLKLFLILTFARTNLITETTVTNIHRHIYIECENKVASNRRCRQLKNEKPIKDLV